jgi:hypothetical protein
MDINAALVETGYRILNEADADERATYEIDGQTVVVVRQGDALYVAHPAGISRYGSPCGHPECVAALWESVTAACAEAEAEARAANPVHVDLDSLIMAEPVTVDMFI